MGWDEIGRNGTGHGVVVGSSYCSRFEAGLTFQRGTCTPLHAAFQHGGYLLILEVRSWRQSRGGEFEFGELGDCRVDLFPVSTTPCHAVFL